MDDKQNEPSESELKKVEKILEQSEKKGTPKVRRKPKPRSVREQEKLEMAIATSLSEFTDCYILLGFDVNGNSMVLINSANNLESRALNDLVADFLDTGGPIVGFSGPQTPPPQDDEED